MYFIFWYDYVALPIYLLILGGILMNYFHRKHRDEPELKKYFTRGMILKFIGGIGIGMVYELYYRGAYDGRWYFEGANVLNTYYSRHPSEILHVFFNGIQDFNNTNLDGLNMTSYFLYADESFFVAKLGGLFNYGAFHMFLPLSLIFCFFAYLGVWNFFVFIQREFDIRTKLAAFCTIFIPSVLVWDSSIFKDTITFTSLCWLFITGYYSFIKPRKVIQNLIGFAVASYLIISVKLYIFAAFAPFFLLFVFNTYKNRISNHSVRALATPFIMLTAVAAVAIFLRNAGDLLGRYSVDNALDNAASTYTNITMYGGAAGSAYELNVDFSSPLGVLAAIPVGINLTLFRPYPWEYAKVFIFFSSIESFLVLYFTVMLFFRGGIGSTFRIIGRTPLLQFCLMFTGLFAFMTGIAAANFGTLVRYKIPCLPFYLLFLVYLYQVKVSEAKEREEAKLRALHDRESEGIPVHSS